jgi:ribonuclease H / adenosylcobalamin/alpha-ribazole phosphatase
MGKLILVRHGESAANRDRIFADEETPLTESGRQQAADAARSIAASYHPDAVVSSSLRRARETAEIIAAELNLPVEIWPGLEEQDFGEFKGKPFDALFGMSRAELWKWQPAGGESTEQTQVRVLAALEGLRARHPDDEVVVVCHGMVMLSLSAFFKGTWDGAEVPPNCAIIVEENHTGGWPPTALPHKPGNST